MLTLAQILPAFKFVEIMNMDTLGFKFLTLKFKVVNVNYIAAPIHNNGPFSNCEFRIRTI